MSSRDKLTEAAADRLRDEFPDDMLQADKADACAEEFLSPALRPFLLEVLGESDEDGRPLCFECGLPQAAHSDGEECASREYAHGFSEDAPVAGPRKGFVANKANPYPPLTIESGIWLECAASERARLLSDEAVEAAARAAFFHDDLCGHIKGRWTWDTIPDDGREAYRAMVRDTLSAALRATGGEA